MGSVPRDPKRRSGAAGTVVPDMSTTTRSAHRTMLAASPMAGIQKEMEELYEPEELRLSRWRRAHHCIPLCPS